jgi:hypothetical protein
MKLRARVLKYMAPMVIKSERVSGFVQRRRLPSASQSAIPMVMAKWYGCPNKWKPGTRNVES